MDDNFELTLLIEDILQHLGVYHDFFAKQVGNLDGEICDTHHGKPQYETLMKLFSGTVD